MTIANNNVVHKQMPLTRRRILTLLKEKGKLTADELAQILQISSVAVRRHLTKLERDSLVQYDEVQRGMGRPSYVYDLGEAASAYFPQGYQALAVLVLETIRDLYGPEGIDAVFRVRSEHLINSYRPKITGENLTERLEQVSELRQEAGYMSQWQNQGDGVFTLTEANCPIFHAVEQHDCLCKQDQEVLSELLQADVVRTSNIREGDNTCSYEIRETTS
ncbi:transcriptional regulator [Anaerolineales bacterium HSG25]|nr:transcriptional regulator [Anaerolineales bacterium HSG25]